MLVSMRIKSHLRPILFHETARCGRHVGHSWRKQLVHEYCEESRVAN
jgi:hypothetical protein